ncbi:MAG TPA: selenocysteine-specific translation elongation factor [Syntrophorhabdaceae bacterium]|nr:selenocysteine-specific translation elongation factor [Syntrophorhabdaceae bacterium]
MKRIVIGTAGHIDHGKTALIRALTGIDCDRLKEEKERGITTELGFAHYRIGNDLLVGIVDVPGHERFIRHMVAGAWGIDMVLFVVAADEGVMPQTREHMDICEILGVDKGIMVITKTDLVDSDMVDLVREDVKDFVAGRPLETAPVIAVSANTGEGMDVLRDKIAELAHQVEERSREGIFRLPVDRVFTIRGLGTVVTGTCISGSIRTGDEIEIYPLSKQTRVKNIQAYHEDAQEAIAGQRVALNLQGIEKNDIERGVIIGRPATLMYSHRIDAGLKYLKLPFKPIKNDTILRLHIAATQVEARLVILDKDVIEPGEERFVQFVFKEPLVALPGDRFILRGSYAIQTIGGGRILDIMPARHRRKTEGLDKIYAVLSGNDDREKILYHAAKFQFAGIEEGRLSILVGKDAAHTRQLIRQLTVDHRVRVIGKTVLQEEMFESYKKLVSSILTEFVNKNPLKAGMSKEELRTKLPKTDPNIFQSALDEMIRNNKVEVDKDKVNIKDSAGATSSRKSGDTDDAILKTLLKYGLATPGLKELATETGKNEKDLRDILNRLSFEGRVVKLKGDMYFHQQAIEGLKQSAIVYLKSHKEMTPSDFKSVVDVSRKYMIPLLEYLDSIKLTIRVGDKRVLRS